jgi:hypothetical protein
MKSELKDRDGREKIDELLEDWRRDETQNILILITKFIKKNI